MGSDEDPRDYDFSQKLFKIGLVIMESTGLSMCLFILVWIFSFNGGISWGTNPATEVNLHIVLMTLFFIYLHGHGQIIYRIFPERPKLTVKLMHGLIHLTTVIAVAIALASAVRAHNMKGDPNFYSIHSWIGLTAIILYYGQFLVGFITFLTPWTPGRIRMLVLPFHKFLGPMIFLLCVVAGITGVTLKAVYKFADKYKELGLTALVLNFAGLFLVLFGLTVVFLVSDQRFRRRPRPEGELLLGEPASASSSMK